MECLYSDPKLVVATWCLVGCTLLAAVASCIVIWRATINAPINALRVQEKIQQKQAAEDRRIKLFKTLMVYRGGFPIPKKRIKALNQIQLEFYGEQYTDVIAAWKHFHHHLGTQQPKVHSSLSTTDQAIAAANLAIWNQRYEDLFVKLLVVMGKSLGFIFNDVDIKTGWYVPEDFANKANVKSTLQTQLINATANGYVRVGQ